MAVGPGQTLEELKAAGWSEAAPAMASMTPEAARAAGHPEAKISAAAPGQVKALAPESVDQFGIQRGVSQGVSEKLTKPLIHPTGIEAIDSLFSPASLALMAATAGPSAVKAVTGAVTNLTETVGERLAGKLLKFVTPSLLKKPAELVSILSDIAEGYKGSKAPAAEPAASAPVAAPAPAQAAPAAPVAASPAPAPVASPAPAQAAPMARPDAFKAALQAFADAKETPRPAEVSNTAALIQRGQPPEQAIKVVLGNRPPSPAAELAKRLGTPTEAEMKADMANRARKGQKSLMPAYGGEP